MGSTVLILQGLPRHIIVVVDFIGNTLIVFYKSLTTIPEGSRAQAIGARNGKTPT